MTKPTALFLANILEDAGKPADIADKAALELRRLHAENEALRKTLAASCDEERQQLWEAGPGGGCSRALSAESQRDELLKALREYRAVILFAQDKQALMSAIRSADDKARAAIAKVEGQPCA